MADLTEKQRLFCLEYIKDFNATRAYIASGYSASGAAVSGSKLLTNTKIQQELAGAIEKTFKGVGLEADRVIQEIMKMAFFNAKDLYDEDGNLKNIHDMPDEVTCCIAGIEVDTAKILRDQDGTPEEIHQLKKVKLWNKDKALETLCKYLGILIERREVKTDTTIRVTVDGNVSETITWMEDTIRKQEAGDTTAIH